MPVFGYSGSWVDSDPVPTRSVSRGEVAKRRAKNRSARSARRRNRKH